jgi:hypothetical protein
VSSETEVEALLADHPDDVARAARRVRAVLREGHTGLVEKVRVGWHSINYHDPAAGFVCALFPTADRVQLVFERGASLPDPHRLLTGTGRQVRALEYSTEADVDPAVVLEYLDLAVELGAALRARPR